MTILIRCSMFGLREVKILERYFTISVARIKKATIAGILCLNVRDMVIKSAKF